MTNFLNKILINHFIYTKDKIKFVMADVKKDCLLEINYSDKSILVSRELIWDQLIIEYNLTDKEVQNFLNEELKKMFKLPDGFICNRMLF